MSEGMLSLAEVMQYLSLDKTGVEELIRRDKLSAYKVGGTYLRFKKTQVVELKKQTKYKLKKKNPPFTGLINFWEFNNIYIITGLFLLGILYFTLR